MSKIRIPPITRHNQTAVHVFYNKEALQHYITHQGQMPSEQAGVTYGVRLYAEPGEYKVTRWYSTMTVDHNLYVREYDTPQWHPDGFNYVGWAVAGAGYMLVG